MRRMIAFVAVAVALLPALRGLAAPELASVFTDHAILQRDMSVPIWGTAAPGEEVTVEFAGQVRAAKADASGKWMVRLKAMRASAEGRTLTARTADGAKREIKDVLVGEVWLGSGQSNMQMPVSRALNATQEIASSACDAIRLFFVERTRADAPTSSVKGAWAASDPASVSNFSAVGYFFARELHRSLKIPVGFIASAWGGTPVEAWMSDEAFASDPALAVSDTRWEEMMAAYPRLKADYDRKSADWRTRSAEARRQGRALTEPAPRPPQGPDSPHKPRGLYNGMIAPLIPYAFRGALWYQGESNAGRGEEYTGLLTAMIRDWRAQWGQGPFPFYFVQLPNYAPGPQWPIIRESMAKVLRLENTAMAVTIDIGDPNDIHPANKQEVARRLALLARNRIYRERIGADASAFASLRISGGRVTVRLKDARGLEARGGAPRHFEIAGADSNFVPAEAAIEGDAVTVWSDQVAAPAMVRYAWTNNPTVNVFNGDGLPLAPFRAAK